MLIRPVEWSDVGRIYTIRNQQTVRQTCENTAYIARDEHHRYWKSVLKSRYQEAYVAVSSTIVVGVVKLDIDHHGMIRVSIYVDEGFRGTRVATQLLTHCHQAHPRKPFYALVRRDNIASLRLFEKQGYKTVRDIDPFYGLMRL